jgi:hypothetical protein
MHRDELVAEHKRLNREEAVWRVRYLRAVREAGLARRMDCATGSGHGRCPPRPRPCPRAWMWLLVRVNAASAGM